MASTVGPAMDGLKAAVAARPALAAVAVDVGYPAGGAAEEQVWVSGQVDDWSATPETTSTPAGLGSRDERFTLVVRVFVHRSEADYPPCRDRALALAGEVEAAVAAEPTLGGAVALAYPAGGRMDEAVRDDGRDVGVEVLVVCRAQLAG